MHYVNKVDDEYVICEEPIALTDLIAELKAGLQLERNDDGIVHEVPLNANNIATAIANELQ